MKRGKLLLLIIVITFLFFQVNFVLADEDSKEDILCLPCGDTCEPSDFVASALCPQSTIGEFECSFEDGECFIKENRIINDNKVCCNEPSPADEPTYRWRYVEECQSPEGAEFGVKIVDNNFCEKDFCTADKVWKGCIYKYEETFKELEEEYEEEEVNPGMTPDSPFYFLDGIFGDTREEKIAEVKQMIEEENYESARVALEKYMEQAKEFENNPDPGRRDEARRAAASIHRMLNKINNIVSEENREEFVDNIRNREGDVVTSVEISTKIKDLCVQLAKLDPLEYTKMCKTNDDSHKWQRDLDEKLTAEQEKIAKDFVNIMKQCFKTSGQDCACEEILFQDFSIACSKAAPLATACDIDGDKIACDNLENLKMPELPEWLEPIWEELDESQYDMHMPEECVEAGVTDPKECGKVMIKRNAPPECKRALLDSGCDSERECRNICDEIMFKLHTPQECIDKGLTGPDECGEFMDNFRGPRDGDHFEGSFGRDCMSIKDPMERLECYDNKGNEIGDYYGSMDGEGGEITWQCKEHRIHWAPDCETFMREELPEIERQERERGDERRAEELDWRTLEKECASSCDLINGWWDFREGECVCYTDERSNEPMLGEWGGPDYERDSGCDDCSIQCPENANTDCINNRCVCEEVPDMSLQYGEGEGLRDFDNNGGVPNNDEDIVSHMPEQDEPEQEVEPELEQVGSNDAITGNAFLNYYFNH